MAQERRDKENEINKETDAGYYGNRRKFESRGPSKIRQMFGRGMTYFLVIAAGILFYFALLRVGDLSSGVFTVIGVLKPIIYGLVLAYLLNPIIKRVDGFLIPFLNKRMENQKKVKSISRTLGILLAFIILIAIISALCNMLIPELYQSIRDLVITLPGQLNGLMDSLNKIEFDNSTTGTLLRTAIQEGASMFQNWLRTDLLQQMNGIMSSLTVGIINAVSEIFSFFIGMIVSIYVLYSKETFVRQSKKVVYALLSARHANLLLHLTQKSNEMFGGFIIGKIINSAIIGVLCFFGVTLLKMPYPLLVSVIIGVTDIIPFFGPYIGGIPCTILILLTDPIKGIYFVIFIFLLQQLDGNFIGPKILGSSTGLSAFWVIFSILVGGGLFGFPGMLMGVPTFAVVYYIVQMVINSRLERKKLPLSSAYYDEYSYVDDSGEYVPSKSQIKGQEEADSQNGESRPENTEKEKTGKEE